MHGPIRRLQWAGAEELEPLVVREWLVTNGLGGYASGTVSGAVTRRYHGLLVAALPAPVGRMLMLSHLSERLRMPGGNVITLSGRENTVEALPVPGARYLTEFRLEIGLPVWHYRVEDVVLEKRILLPHEQNTVCVNYRIISGDGTVRLKLLPSVAFRAHEAPVGTPLPSDFELRISGDRCELTAAGHPALRMMLYAQRAAFTSQPRKLVEVLYRLEESRGYEAKGDLWTPGYFRADLTPDHDVTLLASTEAWESVGALAPDEVFTAEHERRRRLLEAAHPYAREGIAPEMVLAADQFIIRPAGRAEETARLRAAGDDARTVVAGYHWFTDWGRDTMISLEGLTLLTGRHAEAGYILRTFAHHVRDGLIPNFFPEGDSQGVYHTADATLWFFHAIDRYLTFTGDRRTLELLLPKLWDIVEHHLRGTRFGIGVDPADGLLRQGAEGYQLTWMDAKVDDWVVTPRRGKAVEINALWYNALRLLETWAREENDSAGARMLADHAAQVRASFNHRFWYEEGGYLYDVVDGPSGNDPSCRPNQLLAISLAHAVLNEDRWEPVSDIVQRRLVTPVGLRSLDPGHPDYKSRYYGDLRSRDAAYHQGTVWAWLIGPFIDAWMKTHGGRRADARRFLTGFEKHLDEACVGSISEIFDAEDPYTARGCVAQAWSVAEVLRCWVNTCSAASTVPDQEPVMTGGAED